MMEFIYEILLEGWKLWLIVGILFFLAEGVNAGTFALFFGGLGALTTALICYFSATVTESGTWQLLIFSGTSLLSLFFLRNRIMRALQIKGSVDGPDTFPGKSARALSVLRKTGVDTGRVLFEGTEWRAVLSGEEGSPDELPEGSVVRIDRIEGLTLYVSLHK